MITPNSVVQSCDSTNRLARELALGGAPHGTWISSLEQTKGKGRFDRTWESPAGNLYLSIILRPIAQTNFTWLPLAVGANLFEVVCELKWKEPLKLKWPNDLWVGEKKLAGILCESVGAGGATVIAGLGLNVDSAPPGAASMKALASEPLSLEEVRQRLVKQLTEGLRSIDDRVVKNTREKFEKYGILQPGDRVRWSGKNEGIVVGLGKFGELLVKTDVGETEGLFAEDVERLRRVS